MYEDDFSKYVLIGAFVLILIAMVFATFYIVNGEVVDRNHFAETKIENEALFGKL